MARSNEREHVRDWFSPRAIARDIRERPVGALIFFIVAALAIFVVGNDRGWWQPPPPLVDLTFETQRDEMAVYWRVSGRKTTNAPLRAQTSAWVYSDGTVDVSPSYRPNGEIDPGTAIREIGERFVSVWYRVLIPSAVFGDAGVALRVCWDYDGYPLQCAQQTFASMAARGDEGAAEAVSDIMRVVPLDGGAASPIPGDPPRQIAPLVAPPVIQ